MTLWITRARTAQHTAARALTAHGIHHPLAQALLVAAAAAAARAWAAGHPVHRLHAPADHPRPAPRSAP
ncbi:hypothetical protein [Streptomyces sp. ITFR-16]|uniref:hypothetical protein n=1 Tax=Streptomyces sp. ITFR-16 TaxID=3075198 RepID=UPI00288B8B0A|nr:hypothetical protein [Streptomyces sp. ITFR-16]WNI27311.1 hypothetical protein RLT58_35835 [Streptomyces sp. ITFR-16]